MTGRGQIEHKDATHQGETVPFPLCGPCELRDDRLLFGIEAVKDVDSGQAWKYDRRSGLDLSELFDTGFVSD